MRTVILVGWHYKTETLPAWVDIMKMATWALSHSLRVIIISDQIHRFSHIISRVTLCDVQGKRELLRALYRYRHSKSLFYYSGHGVEDNMVLPSQEHIMWNDVYRILNHRAFDVTYIFDCCFPPTFSLPYLYGDGWKGSSQKLYEEKILVFCPSLVEANVESGGSTFTRCIISHFEGGKGYDNMYAAGIVISSTTPHPPLFHPTLSYRYYEDKLHVVWRE
jgi:hypothetical protein